MGKQTTDKNYGELSQSIVAHDRSEDRVYAVGGEAVPIARLCLQSGFPPSSSIGELV
jgi:hypothetical protein